MNLLKQKRKEKNLTMEQVAEIVGVGKSTVSKWESGAIDNMGRKNIIKLAKALEISPLDVLGVKEERDSFTLISIYNKLNVTNQINLEDYAEHLLDKQQKTKVVGFIDNSVAAANPMASAYGDSTVTEEHLEEIEVPTGAEFSIKIKGDSMEELIPNGSRVFYKKQETIENGEIAIVEISGTDDGDGITCKKVNFDYENKKIILHSLNEKYDDRILPADKVKIIGKVLFN